MTVRRRLRGFLLGLLLAALAGCGGDGIEPTPRGEVIAPDDRLPAPELGGALVGGGQLDSAPLGGVTVVNFWGSWCGPCRVEMPEFQDLADANGDVRFIGVNVRDDEQLALSFLVERGISYPSVYDPAGELVAEFSPFPVSQTPSTVVIDAEDRVAAAYLGAVSSADLQAALDAL